MNRNYQQGSAHMVVIVCLVVALIGALGWIFWQNTNRKDTVENGTDTVASKDDSSVAVELPDDIDYTKNGQKSLVFTSATDIEARSDLSESLKKFLAKTLEDYLSGMKNDGTCKNPGKITAELSLSRVYKQKYASGALSGGSNCGAGGAAFLWADINGVWQRVAGTQSYYACSDLKKYAIPSTLVDGKCQDGNGVQAYTQD